MTFPSSSMRWQQQSWPRPAAQHLWNRERRASLWLSYAVHLWYQVLGFLSWAIDEDKDPWKELSCEWENCSFHLAQSFQFFQLSWCGCQTFKSVVFQIIPRPLFWRPVSYLQPSIILSLSALNCISNRTIAATCINLFWPWEEVRFSLHVYTNQFLTLMSCK